MAAVMTDPVAVNALERVSGFHILPAPGGIPIRYASHVVGGIGVSGASGGRDERVAVGALEGVSVSAPALDR